MDYPKEPLRLTFQLPSALLLSFQPGRHSPCLHGCVLTASAEGRVEIAGPSRDRLFEQAARFLRVVAKGHGPQYVTAVLRTPRFDQFDSLVFSRDTWTVTVGADVSFSATGIPPYIAERRHGPPPRAANRNRAKAS